jgi:hypothetical protein
MTSAREAKDRAVREALALLRQVWPRRFALTHEEEQVTIYGRALGSITIDCVVPGAERYVAEQKYPPTPAELREYAVREQRIRYPHVSPPALGVVRDPDLQAHLDALDAQRAQMDRVAVWLVRRVRSLEAVFVVFAIVWHRAATDEDRARIRRGGATREEVAAALAEWEADEERRAIAREWVADEERRATAREGGDA